MISKELALEAALDYLTSNLRHRLEVTAGWPGEAKGRESGEQSAPSLPRAISTDPPGMVDVGASQDGVPEQLPFEAQATIKGFPKRVWSVRVPDDKGHVGSSRYLVIDADTGHVFTSMIWGE